MKHIFLISLFSIQQIFAQSGPEYRRSAVMNANQVRTVFGNWGVIGQPASGGPRGAWKNDNNGYLGDVSPLVGAEVKSNNKTFHSVVTTPTERPTILKDENPQTGKLWTFEPIAGYNNANQQKVAISTDKNSWPPFWPDKMGDVTDPGWKNSWNGYFGKKVNADQETYFMMDDNNDERFNFSNNNTLQVAFKPDTTKLTRNGLGLEVRVRAMQWSQFLAKDNTFWLYEITNTGTTNYDKVVFGMIVGTYIGVTGANDGPQEYNDDWSFYDVNTNITYTGDYGRNTTNPLWVGPIGMVGYAFLESPGNPYDGIDNDGDADNTPAGLSMSQFTSTSFDSLLLSVGKTIVLINNDYSRTLYTIPNVDSVQITTHNLTRWIRPGITKVAEGNIINNKINDNVYDGIDNDYDGLIDENYYLHYRQIKKSSTNQTLIDILRPVRYVDYTKVNNPYSMLDEKRNDGIDNDNDWTSLDDVGRDGIKETGDFGEGDNQPTSGYNNGFDTGLPGEPHIDKTDVSESDQIGLTSFFYTAPANTIALGNDEGLWKNLSPGFFDVPVSIVDNRPQAGEDGDFMYGSGYFPLLAKNTERFSLALVYGGGRGGSIDDDINDLLKNKKTVQKIYDANYQFPQPPERPTLTAVADDRKVTLYWDRKAEESIDPVLQTKDFEGYKIYKSTDPNFSDIFTITDGSGTPQGYIPLAQFDMDNGIEGYFKATGELYDATAGFPIYLGSDNGLQHTYVDYDVKNGQRYYYAIVAYDRGDDANKILPSENTKFISISPSGEISHDENVVVVVPNAKSSGYTAPKSEDELVHLRGDANGSISYKVVDPTKVTGHTYQVEFVDTENDGIDNNNNSKIDEQDSTEWDKTTTFYSVRNMNTVSEEFTSEDTAFVTLQRKNLVGNTITVKNQNGNIVSSANYKIDTAKGTIRGVNSGNLPSGKYTIEYQYYPIYRSPNMQNSPYAPETKDADIFDGVQLVFNNYWSAQVIDSATGWVGQQFYNFSVSPLRINVGQTLYQGIRKPGNYVIEFSDKVVDTTYINELQPDPIPVKFRIFSELDNKYIKFIYADDDFNNKVSIGDKIAFIEESSFGKLTYTWYIEFSKGNKDTVYDFTSVNKINIKTTIPFNKKDNFEFTVAKPTISENRAKDDLSKIKVVPNPYVVSSSFELPLNPGVTSGRNRKIDFTHLPADAKINIFTSRGEHIITLNHDGNMEDGTVSWNLKTKENLDIAFGVYFYVVESSVGKKTGKIAIIK